jgi:hypothetical protein
MNPHSRKLRGCEKQGLMKLQTEAFKEDGGLLQSNSGLLNVLGGEGGSCRKSSGSLQILEDQETCPIFVEMIVND